MTRLFSSSALVLGSLALVLLSTPVMARTLKVGGTGAVTQLLVQLAPAFAADSGITLDVVPALGTSGANRALADGKLGVAVSGRELRDRETAVGLKVALTLRTPIGFITSRPGPDDVKKGDVVGLFRADRAHWPDGMPILVHLRPADESDYIVLGKLFPGMTEAIAQLHKRRDLSVAATDQDNADMAEKVKGSLAPASVTQIVAEKRNLRFLSIDGAAATLENDLNGSYPYGKSIHVIVPAAVSPEAEAFLAFLAKPATASLLRDAAIIVGP